MTRNETGTGQPTKGRINEFLKGLSRRERRHAKSQIRKIRQHDHRFITKAFGVAA